MLLVSLLFVGPGALLSSATALDFTDEVVALFPELDSGTIDPDLRWTNSELERLLEALVPFLGASLLSGILGSIGALAFSKAVADDYHARPAEASRAVRAAVRRTPSALVFMLVTGLLMVGLIVVGLVAMTLATLALPVNSSGVGGPGTFVALIVVVALIVAIVYLSMRWAPAYTAMVEEGAGWRAALSRSWHLSGDSVLRIFAVSAMVAIITWLLSALLGALFEGLLGLVGASLELDVRVTSTIALAMATVIVAPVMPVLMAVLFFDLRARHDAPSAGAVAPPPPGPYG
jgi:hypothetical protein